MKIQNAISASLAAAVVGFSLLTPCANGAVFIQPTGISTQASLTGGTSINNIIQATSLSYTEEHQSGAGVNENQVWVRGANASLNVLVDLGDNYDLREFYFWNDSQTGWAVDDITMIFLDSSQLAVGNWSDTATIGINPSMPETFSISANEVRFVDITFSGRGSGVEPTDLAFGAVPEPSVFLLAGLGGLIGFRRTRR